jgi:hypothetical protein
MQYSFTIILLSSPRLLPCTPEEESVEEGEVVKAEQALLSLEQVPNVFPDLGKNTGSYEFCALFLS